MKRFRHTKQYWIGLHNSGLLHPLWTRNLLVAFETVWTPENVQRVAHAFQCSPQRSARRHSIPLLLTPRNVWRILHEDLKFHPFKIQLVQQLLIPVIWINGVNVAGNSCKWSRERHKRTKMCLTSNGAHPSDIIFKKWLENVMLFHVAYRCLASYDLIFN